MRKIFVNGVFDILHLGHIKLLEYASTYGEVLVAIDSDTRVRELKGADRPYNVAEYRKAMLLALRSVKYVEVFNSDQELINIIKKYSPDIMVKGSDYIGKPILGDNIVPEILFFGRMDEYSTTKIMEDLSTR